MNLLVSMSHTDYIFLKVDASTDLYQSSNQFKAVNVDAIAIAIATQSTIKSAISKNCNCQKLIATAIRLLLALTTWAGSTGTCET